MREKNGKGMAEFVAIIAIVAMGVGLFFGLVGEQLQSSISQAFSTLVLQSRGGVSAWYNTPQGSAFSNCQQAEIEASRARNAALRVRNDSDNWSRRTDAWQADSAAENAYYAAHFAELCAASNGVQQSRDYAIRARSAANEARKSAHEAWSSTIRRTHN